MSGGVEELVTTLVPQLAGSLHLATRVLAVEPVGECTRLHLSDGQEIVAGAVVFATPAFVTADLFAGWSPAAAQLLDGIRYVSTGTISFAFRAVDAPNPLRGYGLVIPSSARRPINAITLSSVKFSPRAPDDAVLLRVFFGGSRSPQSMELDDATLYTTVRKELAALLGHHGGTALSSHFSLGPVKSTV